jgi:hypothetical protein
VSVRVTTAEGKAALFDSVTGLAFGPVFDSELHADEFLIWLDDTDGRDARDINTPRLNALKQEWEKEVYARENIDHEGVEAKHAGLGEKSR